MTKAEIIARVQRNLDDEGANFFTPEDHANSIQDGYNEAVCYTESIEGYNYLSLTAGKVYYDFIVSLPDFKRVVAIFNPTTKLWLESLTVYELQSIREDWELANGQPRYYCVISPRIHAIFPTPAVDVTNGLIVFAKKTPVELSLTDIPILPTPKILEYFATQDLLDQVEEYGKASRWLNEYIENVKGDKKHMEGRLQPDRVLVLKALGML